MKSRFQPKSLLAFAIVMMACCTCAQSQPPLPVGQRLSPQDFGGQPLEPAPQLSQLPNNQSANSVRVKDVTFLEGERVNHVSGAGLVLGLSGTGGTSEQTAVMATNYYLRKGIQLGSVDTNNMSAVLVSGKIPAYARKGETIFVTVSVADDASSLRGGTLNQTALRGIDDEIYAIAQGPIIGGGVSAEGDAASVQKNHPTVGVCEAIVEREIGCEQTVKHGRMRWVLRNKTHQTATLIANAFNVVFPRHARAIDAGTIEVVVPRTFQENLPAFVSIMGDLRITPDVPARVVVNQKTGTIILGQQVKISPVVFASENIVIATNETPTVSQPEPFSNGETVVVPRTTVEVTESGGRLTPIGEAMSVGDLANALNALGVSPTSLIHILSSLRTQGALQAELVIE